MNINLPPFYIEKLEQLLSFDEQQRAARFQFDHHRKTFVVGRGILRFLLSRYIGCLPEQIDFFYNTNGKPFLSLNKLAYPLFFNLSHSADTLIYAIAGCRWIGVDIQYIREDNHTYEIANRYFHPNEKRLLNLLPVEYRKKAFYMFWTCKEAYLKATGEGLAGLDQVEILNTCNNRIEIKRYGRTEYSNNKWSLFQIEPEPAYSGALAILGYNWNLIYNNIQYEKLLEPFSK